MERNARPGELRERRQATIRIARWQGLALACVLILGLAAGGSARSLPTAPSPFSFIPSTTTLTGYTRFPPLPTQATQATHEPPTPDLPPPPVLSKVEGPSRNEPQFRYAVHTLFLDEVIAPLAADVGFDTVVQVFPWRDLNPRPNLYAWDASDYMVRTARAHGLDLVVRLDMPPEWAVVPDEYGYGGIPFDLLAYADFVSAVAERYRGHVLGYIVWNEPNLAAEWSRSGGDLPQHWESFDGWVADPADYVAVLCTAYDRIRAADPNTLIVAAGLAPTNEISPRALDDREFLRGMYAAGAASCFDVLSVHDYGYGLSPEDERGSHGGLNLARILDLRDVMLEYGDHKPVWITELGYTIQPGLHPSVTEEDQALYLTGSFERVRRDWPWVEMLTVWNMCYDRPADDEMSGYSLTEPDLTPRPAYWALREMFVKRWR